MIKEKIYYFVELKSQSPLSIGNGEAELTDHDLIRDSKGMPFIPATSIAGACVHYLTSDEQKIMNPITEDGKIQSPFFISDAILLNTCKTSIRDGIALNENKITKDGAKYDMEILERDSEFSFRIEVTVRDKDETETMKAIVNKILASINKGNILFGLKSKRGFGKLKVENVYIKEFKKGNIVELVDFKKYNKEEYEKYEIDYNFKDESIDTIEVELKQLGGISIRSYSAKAGEVDFEHIKSNGEPIIPGTSWNGLIRKQVEYYNEIFYKNGFKYDTEKIFGYVNENKGQASKIIIEESIIDGGKEISLTRNKIDRFSGGAADSALFSEKAWFNGTTKLTIKLPAQNNYIRLLILLTIKDIENGLIALGGQTAIGRGIFEVENVYLNGELINLDDKISKFDCSELSKNGGNE